MAHRSRLDINRSDINRSDINRSDIHISGSSNIYTMKRDIDQNIDRIDQEIRDYIITRNLFEPVKVDLDRLIELAISRLPIIENELGDSDDTRDMIDLISEWVAFLFDNNPIERDAELVYLMIDRIFMAYDIADLRIMMDLCMMDCMSRTDIKNKIYANSSDFKYYDINRSAAFKFNINMSRTYPSNYFNHFSNLITVYDSVIYHLSRKQEVEYIWITYIMS